jgi:hypothetical protein
MLVLVAGIFAALPLAANAASNNGNNGNNGNQNNPITNEPLCYPLHQYTGEPIEWKSYRDGSDFGLNENKGETKLVPGYSEYGENGVFWHFINPDKLGGYADITFVDADGVEFTVKDVMPYKNDQHFGVVTDRNCKLLSAAYYPSTAPKKEATQFNLSHTAGKPDPKITLTKIWKDVDGNIITDLAGLEALFTFNGNTVKPGTYEVPVGTYTIIEDDVEGFELICIAGANIFNLDDRSATITVEAGKTYTVTFTNKDTSLKFHGGITLTKTVGGEPLTITWFCETYGFTPEQAAELLEGISFALYKTNDDLTGYTTLITEGEFSSLTGAISFYNLDIVPGWYALVETLTGPVLDFFEHDINGEVIWFIYYVGDNNIGEIQGGTVVSSISSGNIDGKFTIGYTGGYSLHIKLIYNDADGNTWIYDALDKPDGSGQQLSTEKFDATLPDGTTAMSFCADLGAHNVYGDYVFDETNHGFSEADLYRLVATLDYINDNVIGGLAENPGKALAQVLIWNIILEVDGDAGYAATWFTDQIVKIEGSGSWYTPEYAALIDNMLENPDDFVVTYNTKLAGVSTDDFVSGVLFIVGNGEGYAPIDQQRQIIVLFGNGMVVNTVVH